LGSLKLRMTKIKKPLLAGNFDPTKAKFPYIATPKIDGIRFLMVDGVAVSRTFKPIRNKYIQSLLQEYLPDGTDGELTSGDTFQSSTSAVMTIEGEPDFKAWIFDYVSPYCNTILPFTKRIACISEPDNYPFDADVLRGIRINSLEELDEYEKGCLEEGYEGVMLRDPQGTYKFGRSTVNDNILLKVKRFEDAEAILIEIEEKMSNQNPEEKDAFGHTKRSSSIAGMVGANTAGTLIVKDSEGRIFGVGSGLNDQMREEIWNNKEKYLGKLVKYKYFSHGVKELPRHPVFLGFRDPDDV
jgi:DNA ligase-1